MHNPFTHLSKVFTIYTIYPKIIIVSLNVNIDTLKKKKYTRMYKIHLIIYGITYQCKVTMFNNCTKLTQHNHKILCHVSDDSTMSF